MATASLMDFLAGDALTKLAQAYSNNMGVVRPLPPEYYASTPNGNVGTTVSWDDETASREAAKVRNPDSPSAASPGVVTANKKAVGLGSRESYTIGLELIQALQQPGDIVRRNAQMELERQVRNFVSRFQTLRTNAVHSAFALANIYVSSAGNIQTSSSSPVRTVTYGVPTANTITTATGSTLQVGDWSSAGTDIPTKVSLAKQYAAKTYSMPIEVAYYGVNVPGYLAKNTAFKEYLARNPQFNTNYVSTGEIPDGVLGLKWVAVGTATNVLDGTGTSCFGDSFLGFSPKVAPWWYEVVDCGLPAPMGLTSEAALASSLTSESLSSAFPIRYGLHSYAVMNVDPPSAKMIVADFHLPLIKSPKAYYYGVCA